MLELALRKCFFRRFCVAPVTRTFVTFCAESARERKRWIVALKSHLYTPEKLAVGGSYPAGVILPSRYPVYFRRLRWYS